MCSCRLKKNKTRQRRAALSTSSASFGTNCLSGLWSLLGNTRPPASGTNAATMYGAVFSQSFSSYLRILKKCERTSTDLSVSSHYARALIAPHSDRCMMAATRGHNSLCPCPVCLAKSNELIDLTKPFELCTTKDMQAAYKSAQAERYATNRDDIFKRLGLRDVEVCLLIYCCVSYLTACNLDCQNAFWALMHTDIYKALCWDRLHAYHNGVFKHLLTEFLNIFDDLPRSAKAEIEALCVSRWNSHGHIAHMISHTPKSITVSSLARLEPFHQNCQVSRIQQRPKV